MTLSPLRSIATPWARAAARGGARRPSATPHVEQRMSLRVMILAMGWWVALSLGSVGTPLRIWAGGAVLLTGAHAFSWYFRTLRSPIRSLVVLAGLLATLALVPTTVRHVLGGDWLPVAYFLLLFLIITALEIRSRGGLDASAALSGVILFVVSQRALDVTFGVFLVGFITLLLAYFAMSFLVDQVRQAEVRWFRSPFSFAFFWVMVLIVTLVVSAGIFVLLPKHVADPIGGAQAIVLPEGARQSGRLLDNESEVPGPMASALPVGPSDEPEKVNGAGDAAAPGVEDALSTGDAIAAGGQPGEAGGGPPSSVEDAARAQGADPVGAGSGPGGESAPLAGSGADEQDTSAAAPRAGSGSADRSERQGGGPGAEDSLVMQVRSPVLTYWRGRVFDRFDGASWSTDLDLWAPGRRRSGSYAIGFQELSALQGRPRYSQIYFLRQSAPMNTVFAGYAPVTASVSSSGDDASRLEEGSVYRVISALPDFSPDVLAAADPRAWTHARYYQMPESIPGLRDLAGRITTGAYTDLERTRRIVTFLGGTYEFDAEAPDDLALTAPPSQFLERRAAGTSMDFASATVLLARAAGIPARLATGYLPGEFDPLTGTYLVRASDRRAWAEIYLGGAGWVPFDAAPRPAAMAFRDGDTYRSPPVNALFRARYGDVVYDSLRQSPQQLAELLTRNLGEGVAAIAGAVAVSALLVFGAFILWKLGPAVRRRKPRHRYVRMQGDGRAEMLRIYLKGEKLLRRAGLAARAPWQSLAEYGALADSRLGGAKGDLDWLRSAAWAAAYDPTPHGLRPLSEAREHLRSMRATLRSHPGLS